MEMRRKPRHYYALQGEFLPPLKGIDYFKLEDQLKVWTPLMESVNNPAKANQLRIEKFIESTEILRQEAIEKANIVFPDSLTKPRSKKSRAFWEIYDLAHKLIAEAQELRKLIAKGDWERAIGWAIDVGRDAMLLQIRRAALDRRINAGKKTGSETTKAADKRKQYARQRAPAWEESIAIKRDEGLARDVTRKFNKSIRPSTVKSYLRRPRKS
jgi:hypothetical protein